MAKRLPRKPKVTATTDNKETTQARLELPTEEFERVRGIAKTRGLSMSAFIRMAVLKEAQRIEEGRD